MSRKKKYEIPVKLVELESGNYHLLVSCEFENQQTEQWVIDTGASKSVFDANKEKYFKRIFPQHTEMQSAGIGEGKIETGAGILQNFCFGKIEITEFEVALINLEHINNLYKNFSVEDISGLLGSDFFQRFKAVIDYNKLIMILYR